MKFGISASEMGALGSPHEVAETAKMAEEHEYEFVTMGDTQALLREVYSTLSLAGDRTSSIDLGPLVTNPVTRHPVVTASSICTINEITNGRAMLGISTGDSAVFTLGERPAKLAEMEQAVQVIRDLVRGREAALDNTTVRLQWLAEENIRSPVPIFWAAEGPKTQRLAGRLADAVLLGGGITPEVIEKQVENVREGAQEAGRDFVDIDIWVVSRGNVADEAEDALETLKPALAGMANHSLRYTLEDKAIPDEYKDRITTLKQEYDSHQHQKTKGSSNVDLLESLDLTEFVAERYAIVGEPEDCLEKINDIQQVGSIDGIYLSTPTNRIREVLSKMANEVISAVR
jgi:5,10-methylenetetrahydromethanopterin reductase